MGYNKKQGDKMEYVDTFVQTCIQTMNSFGIFAGIFLILLESIIPALPLSVFITLNLMTYGNVVGFLLSWLATILGCSLSFFLFRFLFREKLNRFIKKKNQKEFEKWMRKISNISFSSLAILIAIPFTPAFFINIAAGLSKMRYRKFLLALLIGKFIMVYFWGYVGTTLMESLTDVGVLLKIVGLLGLAYILSKIMEKKMNV